MAYFSNSTEGDILDRQCSKCRYGEGECPIRYVQTVYNYDAAENDTATKILNCLVSGKGICQMRKIFKKDLATDGSVQQKLF